MPSVRLQRLSRRRARGFTLTELVVTIVIATVLAAFAIARIDRQGFDTEGYASQVSATVRYGQKLAIAQRRSVTVTASGNSLSLSYAAPVSAPVRKLPSTDDYVINAPSGVTIAAATFTFDALGRPSAGTTLTVTGDVARVITIEAETGYVH
jgi:MSHA pilin protein MshC